MSDYDNAYLKETRSLPVDARNGLLPTVFFRDKEVERLAQHFARNESVLVVGPPGAGKTAVIHATATWLASIDSWDLRQISTNTLLTETRFIGDWNTKLAAIAKDAREKRGILYFTDIWNLATVGRTSADPSSVLDALRPMVQDRSLVLLGEVTPDVLERMLQVPGFATLFSQVEVNPLDKATCDEIVRLTAQGASFPLDAPTRRALGDLVARFLPSRPGPGPALTLLKQMKDYHAQKEGVGEPEAPSPAFAEKVFSIYSGLPLTVVGRSAPLSSHALREWFQERVVGQPEAIDAVVEAISLFKAGLNDPDRPIGSFLFVGPTGVGKTEMAKALATWLFGSPARLLRFDLTEYKDYHSFEKLIGNPKEPTQPARLTDPVKAQPFQVVLFDEIEKGHSNVWDLCLQMLDEGRITPAVGPAVDFRSTLFIATSNLGSTEGASSMGFGPGTGPGGRSAIRKAVEREFRPEFLNRFQHVVPFQSLSPAHVARIGRMEIRRILEREGITSRNLVVDVDDGALALAVERGWSERYGARALKREIQRTITLPLAMALTERGVTPGAVVRITARDGRVQVRILESEESRVQKAESRPIKLAPGREVDASSLVREADRLQEAVEDLARDLEEPRLSREREALLRARSHPEFWSDEDKAQRVLRDLDLRTLWLDRLEALRERARSGARALAQAQSRKEREEAARRLIALEPALVHHRREMKTLGFAGFVDALLEIHPMGAVGRPARDLLVRTYTRWAQDRSFKVQVVREPLEDDESVLLALEGPFAWGYLRGEAGLHRVRVDPGAAMAGVRVGPWTDASGPVTFGSHRALKKTGQLGGRIRSRVECEGLVLQNDRVLSDNRDWAAVLAPSWYQAPPMPEEVVRKYELSPFRMVDVATGTTAARADALKPARFQELLAQRVDPVWGAPPGTVPPSPPAP